MAAFVQHRIDTINILFLIIQQNIGSRVVTPRSVSTAAFAPVFIAVHPPAEQTILQHFYIIFAQRLHGLNAHVNSFPVGDMKSDSADDRHIAIIKMKLR